MAMKVELIDELLKGCKTQEDVFGEGGIFKQLVKAISERAMQAELTTHLGYEKHEIKGKNSGNSRNGTSSKTVKGEFGEAEIAIPRDRAGTFEPRFIPKCVFHPKSNTHVTISRTLISLSPERSFQS